MLRDADADAPAACLLWPNRRPRGRLSPFLPPSPPASLICRRPCASATPAPRRRRRPAACGRRQRPRDPLPAPKSTTATSSPLNREGAILRAVSTINEACVLCLARFDLTPVAPSPMVECGPPEFIQQLLLAHLLIITELSTTAGVAPLRIPGPPQNPLPIFTRLADLQMRFEVPLKRSCGTGSIGQGILSSLPESSGSCSLHHLRPGGGGKPQGRSLRGIQCAQTPSVTPLICRSLVLLLVALRSRRSSGQMHSVLSAAQAAQMRFWSSISRGLCRKRSTLAASSSIAYSAALQRSAASAAVQRVCSTAMCVMLHCKSCQLSSFPDKSIEQWLG